MPETSLQQSQTLKQEQTLSTRQMQSLELLQLPVLELQDKLREELERNPMLEAGHEGAIELAGDVGSPDAVTPEAREAAFDALDGGDDGDIDYNLLPEMFASAHDGDADGADFSRDRDREERWEYFLNNLQNETTLQDELLDELRFSDAPNRLRRLAELVIGSIDDSGYLTTPDADIAMAGDASLEETAAAIALVQSFDPPGVGAHNLAECLKLQLDRAHEKDPGMYELLNHLEELGANKYPALARKMNRSIPELNALVAKLRSLDPAPGTRLAPAAADFVAPECEIAPGDNGGFKVLDRSEHLPRPVISEKYMEMLESPDTPPDARRYLREKLGDARELLRALEQRQSTLHDIAEVLCATQTDFLREGVAKLHPLTMQQVAERIGRHETTVSRAIAGKYIKTPHGLFEFKFFFTGGYRSDAGEDVSSRAVKEKIRELIEQENPAEPLSDDRIAQMLKDASLKVSRRTVAKYREAMKIPSTYLRKEHR